MFLLTDGEVCNIDQCVSLARENNGGNRVFTLGIGARADSGLVHGLADASGGDSAYVMDERISETVIPQLKASMTSMNGTNVETHDQLQSTRHAQIRHHSQSNYMVKSNKEFNGDEIVLISGRGKENVGMCVTTTKTGPEQCDSLSDAFKTLFSYELIQELTRCYQNARDGNQRNEPKAKVIELSKSSGVLSMFTSFVRFSERQTPRSSPRHQPTRRTQSTQSSVYGVTNQLFVKTLTGKHLTICGCAAVNDIKERIQDQEGIPPDQARLICREAA